VIKAVQPQEMQELQQKLLHLRKEQQAADAARDKAWKQLKVMSGNICVSLQPNVHAFSTTR
jgi:flagellar basal body rod protein FlgF